MTRTIASPASARSNYSRRSFLGGAAAIGAMPLLAGAARALTVPYVKFYVTAFSGVAEMATWTAFKEDDSVLGTATGDVTSLLSDALAYAGANGIPFHAVGRTYSAGGVPAFMCLYDTVKMGGTSVCNAMFFDNCNILIRPTDNTKPGLLFDSFEDLTLEHRGGQIVYAGGAAAIRFKPTTLTPVDNAIQCNLAKIKFQACTLKSAPDGSHPAVIEYDPTQGSIWGGQYNFGEVDGLGIATEPIRVLNPSANTFFQTNHIGGSMVCNAKTAAIQEGMNYSNQANIRHNTYVWNSIEPGNVNADGFNTFGVKGRLEVGLIGSDNMAPGVNRGIVLEPGSAGWRYSYADIKGAAAAVVDAGTGNVRY